MLPSQSGTMCPFGISSRYCGKASAVPASSHAPKAATTSGGAMRMMVGKLSVQIVCSLRCSCCQNVWPTGSVEYALIIRAHSVFSVMMRLFLVGCLVRNTPVRVFTVRERFMRAIRTPRSSSEAPARRAWPRIVAPEGASHLPWLPNMRPMRRRHASRVAMRGTEMKPHAMTLASCAQSCLQHITSDVLLAQNRLCTYFKLWTSAVAPQQPTRDCSTRKGL